MHYTSFPVATSKSVTSSQLPRNKSAT